MNVARQALEVCAIQMQAALAQAGEVSLLVSFTKEPFDEDKWQSRYILRNQLPCGATSHPKLPLFRNIGGWFLYDRVFAHCWLEVIGEPDLSQPWYPPYLDQAVRAAEAARKLNRSVVQMDGDMKSGAPWSYNLALWLLKHYGCSGMPSSFRVFTPEGEQFKRLPYLCECDVLVTRAYYTSTLYAKWLASRVRHEDVQDLPTGLKAAILRAVYYLSREGRQDECRATPLSHFLNSPDAGPLCFENGGKTSVSREAAKLIGDDWLRKASDNRSYELTHSGAELARRLLGA